LDHSDSIAALATTVAAAASATILGTACGVIIVYSRGCINKAHRFMQSAWTAQKAHELHQYSIVLWSTLQQLLQIVHCRIYVALQIAITRDQDSALAKQACTIKHSCTISKSTFTVRLFTE
jgi:hypothetical protein